VKGTHLLREGKKNLRFLIRAMKRPQKKKDGGNVCAVRRGRKPAPASPPKVAMDGAPGEQKEGGGKRELRRDRKKREETGV